MPCFTVFQQILPVLYIPHLPVNEGGRYKLCKIMTPLGCGIAITANNDAQTEAKIQQNLQSCELSHQERLHMTNLHVVCMSFCRN